MTEPKVVHRWTGNPGDSWLLNSQGVILCNNTEVYISGFITAELARLAARVEALLDARQADCENIQRHMAENERLREALERVLDTHGFPGDVEAEVKEIAEQALERK